MSRRDFGPPADWISIVFLLVANKTGKRGIPKRVEYQKSIRPKMRGWARLSLFAWSWTFSKWRGPCWSVFKGKPKGNQPVEGTTILRNA